MLVLSPTLMVAFLGGLAPALVWLTFWLFEDSRDPEPKRYIFFTFIAGMVAVFPVMYIEKAAIPYIDPGFLLAGATAAPALLLMWAIAEETFKFFAAYVVSLSAWVFDEPIDAVIYMVTAALGFSSLENTLFLFGAINQGGILHGIVTSDLRFIGASLLHILSSSTIGIALAVSFYKSVSMRRLFAVLGVILAIALHTLFNFFILNSGGGATFFIFLFIWFGIIAVLGILEKIKQPLRATADI